MVVVPIHGEGYHCSSYAYLCAEMGIPRSGMTAVRFGTLSADTVSHE
jgi:hypothetical protein